MPIQKCLYIYDICVVIVLILHNQNSSILDTPREKMPLIQESNLPAVLPPLPPSGCL